MKKLTVLVLALLSGTAARAQDVPKAELFLGYSFVRVNAANDVPSFSSNGGSTQVALKLNKWVSGVFDFGGYHNGVVGGVDIDNTVYNFLAGPRVSIRNATRVTPYFHVLLGAAYATASTAVYPAPLSEPTQNGRIAGSDTGFAMATGGGLDVRLSRHVTLRPIALDYFLTRMQSPGYPVDNNQHNLRYSAGINFTFGGEAPSPPPPPPPSKAAMKLCWDQTSVLATEECPLRKLALGLDAQKNLCPGESLLVSAPMGVPEGSAFHWSINGEEISQGPSLEFGATGRQPGSYEVALRVKASGYEDASARSAINVLAYRPPTGSLDVAPIEIWQGEQATIAARFAPGQCGGELGAPAFSASEGAIRGNQFDSAGVQFDPTDNSEQRKTVRLSAKASDERGSASAEASVVVKRAGVVMAKRLPDVVFPEGSARVNNCGARLLLEELKSYASSDPGGRVVFVGHLGPKEAGTSELDRKRALNAAAMISAGTGICSSFPANRILIGTAGSEDNGVDFQSHFCGTSTTPLPDERPGQRVQSSDSDAKFRRVEVWFVPSGGSLPASVKDPKDAVSLSVGALGCPR